MKLEFPNFIRQSIRSLLELGLLLVFLRLFLMAASGSAENGGKSWLIVSRPEDPSDGSTRSIYRGMRVAPLFSSQVFETVNPASLAGALRILSWGSGKQAPATAIFMNGIAPLIDSWGLRAALVLAGGPKRGKPLLWLHEGPTLIQDRLRSTRGLRTALRRVSLVALSPHLRTAYTKLGFQCEHALPEFPALARTMLGPSHYPASRLLLCGASLQPRKGPTRFVQLAEMFLELEMDWFFVWIGRTLPVSPRLPELRNLLYLENLPHRALVEWITRSGAVALLSHEDPDPLFIREAIQLNKPLVTSKEVGTPSAQASSSCRLDFSEGSEAAAQKLALFLESLRGHGKAGARFIPSQTIPEWWAAFETILEADL